jgi:hypothetical protein
VESTYIALASKMEMEGRFRDDLYWASVKVQPYVHENMGFVLPNKAERTAKWHDALHKNATRMNEWHKSPA